MATSIGKALSAACRKAGITDQIHYRSRKEFGRLKVDQAKRLKELEQENSKPKRLVAELSLDEQNLQELREMYRFCTAEMPIRAILAISEVVISGKVEQLQPLFFPVFVAKSWWIRARGWTRWDCSSPT